MRICLDGNNLINSMQNKFLRILIIIIFYVCAVILLRMYGLEKFEIIPLIIMVLLLPRLSDETITKIVRKVVGWFFNCKILLVH